MALIDYDADIIALGAPTLAPSTDEPYQTYEAEDIAVNGAITRWNDPSEQRVVVLMDVIRAYLETLTRRDELQRFHHAISRMMGEVAYNRVYEDLSARIEGNVPVAGAAGAETIGYDWTAPDGTVTVVAPVAVGAAANLAALVANINGLVNFGAGTRLEAYARNGRLGFQSGFTGAAADSTDMTYSMTGTLVPIVGMTADPFVNAVRAAARRALAKGVEHFLREIRRADMP